VLLYLSGYAYVVFAEASDIRSKESSCGEAVLKEDRSLRVFTTMVQGVATCQSSVMNKLALLLG
ncbi:MAG: hypothetical protein K0R67_1023, partial [Paenibacillus sp.]|nr:hypothetical protein [Paenibacillus sp.]